MADFTHENAVLSTNVVSTRGHHLLRGTNEADNITLVDSDLTKLIIVSSGDGNDINFGSNERDVIHAGDGNDFVDAGMIL